MVMKKSGKDYEILMNGDGDFFFGRMLKSGEMSADSVKIEGDTVVKLIAAYFENFCKAEGKDTLLIQNPQGIIVIKQVSVEQIKSAVSEKKAQQALPVRQRRTRKTTTKTRDN